MDFKEYQDKAATTCLYKPEVIETCLKLGLMEEAGEVCGVYKKMYRDNNGQWDDARKEKLLKELGDVTWYIAMNYKQIQNMPYAYNDKEEMEVFVEFDLPTLFSSIVASAAAFSVASLTKDKPELYLESAVMSVKEIGRRFGWTLSDIFEANIAKLTKRKEENKIHGEGSDR